MKIGNTKYMTTAEVAEFLSVSPRTAREIMRARYNPHMVNARVALWRPSEVRAEAARRQRKQKQKRKEGNQ